MIGVLRLYGVAMGNRIGRCTRGCEGVGLAEVESVDD